MTPLLENQTRVSYNELFWEELRIQLRQCSSPPIWSFLSFEWRYSGGKKPKFSNFLDFFMDWRAIGNRDQRKENWRGSRLLISSFDFRRSLHSGFDHIKAENDVTVAVRSRFSIFFVQKIVILILEISLAKYEVILTSRSRVSFSCSTTANFHFPPSGAIWAKNETVISHDPADQHGRFLAFITSNEHNKRKNMVFVQLLRCFY